MCNNSVYMESNGSGMGCMSEILEECYKVYTINIVSRVAYLLGVAESVFDKESDAYNLDKSVFSELEEKDFAKTIRVLCTIRYKIIQNFNKISNRINYDIKNLDTMEDIFNIRDFRYLEEKGINLIKANYKLSSYLVDINKLIVEKISACKELFPLWVEWDYIRNIFIMPKGLNTNNVKTESNKYTHNLNSYPYQVYMGWMPKDVGNILHHDKKFLELLYKHHGKVFSDLRKVTDASVSMKKSIYSYLEDNEDTVVVVDCENSNPYKLCGVFKSLGDKEIGKIKKIILLNDIHTATAWSILERFVSVPVENIMIERVNNNKSLVDIRLTAETCREHFSNNINSFVLCSSDSDYWGLISSLDKANFLVMVENGKCGKGIQDALDEAGILYCSMDDFTDGNINTIKIEVLKTQIQEYIKQRVSLNVNDMLEDVYTQTRIDMSSKEKKQFYDNYIKSMRLSIKDNGNVDIVLK